MEGFQWGGGGEQWGDVQGIGSIIGRHKIDKQTGEVKNSIRNREAKELIFMAHGLELQGGMWEGGGVQEGEGIKGRKILGKL